MNSSRVTPACPYPYTKGTHEVGAASGTQSCDTCQRPIAWCARCGAPNRLLSRFCRVCGSGRGDVHWSCRGGESASSVLQAARETGGVEVRWTSRQEAPLLPSPLIVSNVLLGLTRQGLLTMWLERAPEPVMQQQLPGEFDIVASPATVDGILFIANQQRLHAVDLVNLVGVSPESGSRGVVLELRGPVCSHVASDGVRRVAVVGLHGGQAIVHGVDVPPGSTPSLLWQTAVAPAPAEIAPFGVAVAGSTVVVAAPDGRTVAVNWDDGRIFAEDGLSRPLSGSPLLVRGDRVLLADVEGAVYALEAATLQRNTLLEEANRPAHALGASATSVVAAYGRELRVASLTGGRSGAVRLPQDCILDPLVGANCAALLSEEGTLYVVDLTSSPCVSCTWSLFEPTSTMPAPPVGTVRTWYCPGPGGQLSAVVSRK